VKFGDEFIGDAVMSRCRRIVEMADNFVDFIGSDRVIVGDWVVVLFHEVWWEGWSGFCLWWEEGILEDVTFSLEVIYAI
jgi:hypothetical protein